MKKIILGIAAALLVSGSANASFILYLDDLSTAGTDIVVQDNTLAGLLTGLGASTGLDTTTAIDVNPLTGAVSYIGSIGGFSLSITTGLSKPILSGPDATILDLLSVNVSGGAGNLEIGLTDTGFTGDENLSFSIGGTTNGSISAQSYLDLGNVAFGQGDKLGEMVLNNGPSFAYDSTTTYLSGVTNPYSLSLVAQINHTGAHQVTSFDAAVNVPEPSVIALFGLGLAGLGVAGRRRQAK